jgi:hypothetical protein
MCAHHWPYPFSCLSALWDSSGRCTVIHSYTAGPRVADAWNARATIAGRTLGGPVHDTNLLG